MVLQLKIKSSFSMAQDYRKVLSSKRLTSSFFDIRVYYRFKSNKSLNNEEQYIRFSVNASKKLGNACTRNLIKRRMRSLARECIPKDVPAYWMFIAKPLFCTIKYSELQILMAKSMTMCKNKFEYRFKQTK